MVDLIAHEWIEQIGGSEKVLDEFAREFPSAEMLCLWNDAPQRYAKRQVHETFLARTPLRRHKSLALPLMPVAWRLVDLDKFRKILVSSHAFAHHLGARTTRPEQEVFVYAHTPARYLWDTETDARATAFHRRHAARFLRKVDLASISPRTTYAVNSRYVQRRARSAWGVEATVIYPPVDVARLQHVGDWSEQIVSAADQESLSALPSEFILGASRFIPYKQLHQVIDAGEAASMPVVLAGSGPEERRLREYGAAANVPVTVLTGPSDALLYSVMQRASAYIFPGIEDFGIMPVESIALGTPAIVNKAGGASEAVLMLQGGVAMDFGKPDFAHALSASANLDMKQASIDCQSFDNERFGTEIAQWTRGSTAS